MSRREQVKVWRRWILDLHVNAYAKATLHTLVQYAGEDGSAWPSMARIARESGMSARKAQGVIHALAAAGLIGFEQSRGRRPNVYQLPMNPARSAAFDDNQPGTQYGVRGTSNPAREVPQPRTVGTPTPHAGHPIGKTGIDYGDPPKGERLKPELNPGTDLRTAEASR